MLKTPPGTQARVQSEARSSEKEEQRPCLSNASTATVQVAVRASANVKHHTTENDRSQMIPCIFIVHVAVKQTHGQQAPANSSTLVNETAVASTAIPTKRGSFWSTHPTPGWYTSTLSTSEKSLKSI